MDTAAACDGARAIARQAAQAGEPLYLCVQPTGYGERGDAWSAAGSMLSRWNFALALADNRIGGVPVDLTSFLTPPERSDAARAVAHLENELLGGDVSEATRRSLRDCVLETGESGPEGERRKISIAAGLLLGSPEFQRK